MFRLIGILVVALAVVAAIGWYRGWFHVQTYSTPTEQKVRVTVNPDQFQQDKAAATQEVHEKVQNLEH